MRRLTGVFLFSFLGQVAHAANVEKPKISILAIFHFEQKKLDLHDIEKTPEIDNKAIKDIQGVIDEMGKYKANKIALENNVYDRKIGLDYAEYVAGRHLLDSGEKEQFGFRMAKTYGHKEIYGVDVHQPMYTLGPALEYVQKNQPRLLPFLADDEAIKKLSVALSKMTIAQGIKYVNSEEVEKIHRNLYGALPEAGNAFLNYGAEATAEWYKRNIGIVANLSRLAEPGDRILLVIGHAHKGILRDLIKNNPRLEYVESSTFLGK